MEIRPKWMSSWYPHICWVHGITTFWETSKYCLPIRMLILGAGAAHVCQVGCEILHTSSPLQPGQKAPENFSTTTTTRGCSCIFTAFVLFEMSWARVCHLGSEVHRFFPLRHPIEFSANPKGGYLPYGRGSGKKRHQGNDTFAHGFGELFRSTVVL